MCSRLGCGASAGASSGRRSTPTMRRISASASRPVCSTTSSASRSFSWSGSSRRRTAEAWTVITLTLWPTTSCSSRAMRARSSATASRACSSRSSSACSASRLVASVSRSRPPRAKPMIQAIEKVMNVQTKSPTGACGSLSPTMTAVTCNAAQPAIAWRRSGRIPNQAEMPSATRNIGRPLLTNPPSSEGRDHDHGGRGQRRRHREPAAEEQRTDEGDRDQDVEPGRPLRSLRVGSPHGDREHPGHRREEQRVDPEPADERGEAGHETGSLARSR